MNKDNIIIYVSSRNNYDMLEGEVLKNINTNTIMPTQLY